jgi:hypothetical protein
MQVLIQVDAGISVPELYCEHGMLSMVAWTSPWRHGLNNSKENPSIKGIYAVYLCYYPNKKNNDVRGSRYQKTIYSRT